MDSDLIIIVITLLLGTVGALLSHRLPASGKAALGLGVLPLLGAWLATVFC